jgi:hypothetical protein
MNMLTTAIAVPGIALVLAGLGGTAVAAAAPSSTLTVQDQGAGDGANVRSGSQGTTDSDGTVGDFKQATDGNESGPLEDAVPQYKAGSK